MSLRLMEIYLKKEKEGEIETLLRKLPILEMWHDHLPDGDTITKVLLKAENTETVINDLQNYLSTRLALRLVILPVEATLPRPEEPPGEEEKTPAEKSPQRISVEELYQKLITGTKVSKGYLVMTALASIVAALGLLKNDVAVIIGSMVIAPLLIPNKALALATALADYKLAKKAFFANSVGFFTVLFIGLIMGIFMKVDPSIPQIASRSNVSHYYIFLALASGVAGAYSITSGVVEALVGVMVAVALLPPLVASGLLAGAGEWIDATGSMLLFLVNVVSINLTAVVTFVLQDIRPQNWWEAEKAKKAVRIAVAVWIVLLFLLAIMILFEQKIKLSIV